MKYKLLTSQIMHGFKHTTTTTRRRGNEKHYFHATPSNITYTVLPLPYSD